MNFLTQVDGTRESVPRLLNIFSVNTSLTHVIKYESPIDINIKYKENYDRHKRCKFVTYEKLQLLSKKNTNISRKFKDLIKIVKILIDSDEKTEFIEDITENMFNLLANKNMHEAYEFSKGNIFFRAVDEILFNESYEIIMSILDQLQSISVDSCLNPWSLLPKEFGADIKFTCSNSMQKFNISKLGNLNVITEEQKLSTIPSIFNTNNIVKYSSHFKQVKKMPSLKYDINWLAKKIVISDILIPEISANELATNIITLLFSFKSTLDLENMLYELLGFNNLCLIEEILKHRDELCSSSVKKEVPKVSKLSVIVESEQERQIKKIIRKNEKKMLRNLNKDHEIFLYLNHEKNKISNEISSLPLLRKNALCSERYPNIYDSFLEAKNTAAYISGCKMFLPSQFQHHICEKYEEIFIPFNSISKPDVDLIYINQLDKIGQELFKNYKYLNHIQSIVFPCAYYTNENILVCAPTGAGKTNIALLIIGHQIKLHMEGDTILKNNFKIVYVAPMKALAAEITRTFSKCLSPLGLKVRELTGDMQLTKSEILETQIIITTPEKWDVMTRKPGDISLSALLKLLIIDEVHLLHGDRGPVIEALVARTLRQIESSQSMIRIVGLSATLPGYLDVAKFLKVNPYKGLFYFDGRFRPVPLSQTFIGIKSHNCVEQLQDIEQICFEKVLNFVQQKNQVMVFVHARNSTVRTAFSLRNLALNAGKIDFFRPDSTPQYQNACKSIFRSKNKQLKDLFIDGFSIHHAGMLRTDRTLVENFFCEGFIRVLVCTSTLAWGVNLPAHAVIIKGTDIYDSKYGSFVDIGILDVMQIFGRAGRPQFDKLGHGIILTSNNKLNHYLSLLTCQWPIESNFLHQIVDNLNAEIALGTVGNIEEGTVWLSYTYFFIRVRANPQNYGVKYQELLDDPTLYDYRISLIKNASMSLDKAKMIRYDERTNYLFATDLGRTASHFYIKYDTIEIFNEFLVPIMTEADLLALLAKSQEFQQLKVRDDELCELDMHLNEDCYVPVSGGSENVHGKVNILLQTYISRGQLDSFSLISDLAYISQNAIRILRGIFEIVLRRGWTFLSRKLLTLCKVLEQRLWHFEHPLKQISQINLEILNKIEKKKLTIDSLCEMDCKEIGHFIQNQKMSAEIKHFAHCFPRLELEATLQPITSSILRICLKVRPAFIWLDSLSGKVGESFWMWVEDPNTNHMYHYDYVIISKKQVIKKEEQLITFTIPIFEPLPSQYLLCMFSNRWLGCDFVLALNFQNLILPTRHPPHTELLDLQPLPITALKNESLQELYSFPYFNPIQTQLFHCLYYTDNNILLGAPTGSGKTIAAEIAMFRIFREYSGGKIVYIAPLKALARERFIDWTKRFHLKLGKNVIELTGDVTPDIHSIHSADIIVTTPEKWDGISRSWQTRTYVQNIFLIIIDEIHLLGEERGPVLEVIVSRNNYISIHTKHILRIIGLSTALANANDLADWLGISEMSLYNFRPSVRPVPLEVHISGFPGKHYCPRMATMNKPTFQAIRTHSPYKPVLIFVSSRRQTRLTALDLIAYLAAEDNPKQWLHIDQSEIDCLSLNINDQNLKLTLSFGIGIHHAGLQEKDRRTVEELFVNQKIQVLIATSTLAWGVNFPAHLVIIKGTEFYDGKTKQYIDFPITDVLQMMGRAGRPQFDDHGIAVILVHDIKKNFYKKFLYEPFPVESNLLSVLPEHLNAEIVGGTICSQNDALDYLTWTYFFHRLIKNPSYYQLENLEQNSLNTYLSNMLQKALLELEETGCIIIEDHCLSCTALGQIASFYYLSHHTVKLFNNALSTSLKLKDLIKLLSDAHEYKELPVRHNEDSLNKELSKMCVYPVDDLSFDNSNTKAFLLLQAHFSRLPLPCVDYQTDLKSVLDQSIRILQAMVDISAVHGNLVNLLLTLHLMQMVIQGCWITDNSIIMLPYIEEHHINHLCKKYSIHNLPEMLHNVTSNNLSQILNSQFEPAHTEYILQTLQYLPKTKPTIKCNFVQNNILEEIEIQELICVVSLAVEHEYMLQIKLQYYNDDNSKKINRKAFCPRFPKPKDEGWFILLGFPDIGLVCTLKRVPSFRNSITQNLTFQTPSYPGRQISLAIYIVSDCYLGLDQQYEIPIKLL